MLRKFDQSNMATFLVILIFLKFKIHDLIKIHPFTIITLLRQAMSVQMRIRAVEGQRPRTGSGRFYKKNIF